MRDEIFVLMIDWENNAEEWWEAAGKNFDIFEPRISEWINKGSSPELLVSEEEGNKFLDAARTLPGWNDGPEYAPNPVIFDTRI